MVIGYDNLRKILEGLSEEEIRLRHGQHDWGGPGTGTHSFVSEWLRKSDAERASREALDARKIAQRANTIAIIHDQQSNGGPQL